MIRVLIPSDVEFVAYREELKKLYEASQLKITDTNSFDFICENTLFYVFLLDKKLIGSIYYFVHNNLLYLNAFASRGNLAAKLQSLALSLTWFSCPIYAEAQNRASAYCLLRTGFRRFKDNLFIYDNN